MTSKERQDKIAEIQKQYENGLITGKEHDEMIDKVLGVNWE